MTEQVFNEWYAEHSGWVRAHIRRMLRPALHNRFGEDLEADLWASVWSGRRNFRGECSPRSWIQIILKRKIWAIWREDAQSALVSPDDIGEFPPPSLIAWPALDFIIDVKRALARLSAEDLDLVRRVYMDGETPASIARAQGKSAHAVECKVSRARVRLRKLRTARAA